MGGLSSCAWEKPLLIATHRPTPTHTHTDRNKQAWTHAHSKTDTVPTAYDANGAFQFIECNIAPREARTPTLRLTASLFHQLSYGSSQTCAALPTWWPSKKQTHTHTLITAFTGTLLFSAGTSVRVQIDRFDLTSTTTRMVIMVMM